MSRPIMLGNGSMLVGLDRYGMVHDFYYPYVGLENHANARTMHHRIGVWVDDQFSWLDDDSWRIRIDYEPDGLVSFIRANNDHLDIGLEFHDFVDHDYNAFCRNIHVVNNANRDRSVRIFFHQVFKIDDSNRGDTALFEPNGHYILDYKGRRSFLIYAQTASGDAFDQYSIGIHGIEGKEGTYRDAEDGELANHPVEHGMVDSTIRVSLDLPAVSSKRVHYWVIAAASHDAADKVHRVFKDSGFLARMRSTQKYWREWLTPAEDELQQVDTQMAHNFKRSLLIMKSHMDRRGSILASGDSEMLNYARDNYSYCWPRDAAFVLWPLVRMGYTDEPKAFFEFARDVLDEGGMLMHKFQPDRAVGSTWHPLVHNNKPELAIQEDETAIVIFLLQQFLETSGDDDFVRRFYTTLVQPAANFMEGFIDEKTMLPHASYDLWEEKFLTSTYTTAVTYAGLVAAAKLAEAFEFPDDAIRWQSVADDIQAAAQKTFFDKKKQCFMKGFLLQEDGSKQVDDTIDVSSIYGAVMFGLYPVDHPDVLASMQTLQRELIDQSPIGGVPRYEYDQYCASDDPYKGNPWFVTTLWVAQLYAEMGQPERVKPMIEWVQSHMKTSGVLSEQIHPVTGAHVSVAPLIWSHAEFVNTVLDAA